MMTATDLLEYKPWVEEYLQRTQPCLSVLSFVNLFLWKDHFDFEFKEINGNLCVLAENGGGSFLYWPPLGEKIEPSTIERCFALMAEKNGTRMAGVSRIENVSYEQRSSFSTDSYQIQERGYEYSYYRKELVDLKGNFYKSKRSSYNHFSKHYNFEYLPYEKEMLEECLDLYEEWMKSRRQKYHDEIFRAMLEDNRAIHRRALEHVDALGLVARVVKVNGKIRAYTAGYPLTEQIFSVLLEIADLEFSGLPVYVFRELCADPVVQQFSFINVMDDFATDNVDKTKWSFRPILKFPIYSVIKNHGI